MEQRYASFLKMPKIPNSILERLAFSQSDYAEGFWKLLKYSDIEALDKPNLTFEEKLDLVFSPDKLINSRTEDTFNVFLKPLVASSLSDAKSQTQLRFYRVKTVPRNQYEGVYIYELDLYTNETACMVRLDNIMCEKLDVMEAFLLEELQMLDTGVGINLLRFDRLPSASCESTLSINDSKAIYGRKFLLALAYLDGSEGGGCQ